MTDLKSMVSVGLTSLAASKFDMRSVAIGKKQMRILCIGHGGGSLPLFLAKHILGRNFHCTYINISFSRTSISKLLC